ncbi:MAG: DUF3962 domain-containing protein [Christensenellaceae bacterium]
MNDKIYPLAYKLSPKQTCTLYYLGFPEAWKTSLLDITRKSNPHFKDEYALPTIALKKLIDSWMDGVIAFAPLKKDSPDEHWLTSCCAYTEKDIKALCDIIKVWVKATYVTATQVSPLVQKLANDFCSTIEVKTLAKLQSKSEVRLTLEDGTVCEAAYQAIPLLAINRLLGQEIILNEQPLHFCYATKNQLISNPIADPKSHHQYSFVFDLSVQTTPPQRKALLLCQMSIRRWISDRFSTKEATFLPESINAHVKISEDKYCQVPIAYDYNAKQIDWKWQDKECYNIWGYEQLPTAETLLMAPAEYAKSILLPFKNGMWGFNASAIGTGVSVIDKASLYNSISCLLGDLIGEQPVAQRVNLRGRKFAKFNSPQEYGACENFRSWVHKCVETEEITFEIYGLWKDPDQQVFLEQIKKKIYDDFGENSIASCIQIRYLCKEVGSLADGMANNGKSTNIQRCDEIVRCLEKSNTVTACIFALPSQEYYSKAKQGDPKQVLRNAFARTGRVVQFINPADDINPHKIENAVYDLYRQLGVVTLIDSGKKQPPFATVPCIGMHICTQVHGIGATNKARFLPIYVSVDVLEGKTRVYCDAFPNRIVSYREACLEMAQLFWKGDLEQLSINASRSPAKQKLIELKNHYYKKENSVLLVVQSDGNTRALWGGISDEEIGGYELTDRYCPIKINVGMPKNPYLISLKDSGIRIVRIRSNQEVPDYYTGLSAKSTTESLQHSAASGVFKYDDVFWGIHAKPNDPQYTSSFKSSKIDRPKQRFAEKDMVELYPLQLQPGDNADEWIFYTNALRHIPIQYNQSTVLPLPLHLAKALEEYLFNV